ncbi:VPLPA-CTERM sorting domain-containing protein [Alphaproteobacteria bacterium GH1-50]|uniref:VPLPA-CTERM sorting domain-containing protein n=2 Tax=Kangsaoukella pontilimi TaxID=2691042 RepID=A0A7C9MS39_9RHOB|nr:VPLPA-CTERM sorting domain-containing protein [Kangsaoukella pontilimi]
MGVCGYANNIGPNPESGANVCLNADGGGNSSDDSIQFEKEEILYLSATDGDVVLESIWVNYNHDRNSGEFDAWTWVIGGTTYTSADLIPDTLGDSGGADWRIDLGLIISDEPTSIWMTAGPNSYISAMSVSAVPLPAGGLLLLAGLGGLAALRRKRA